jgi:hypothetical protein
VTGGFITAVLSLQGAPFYADQQSPMAPCPLCQAEKDDNSPKALYAIYGPSPEECDGRLPRDWFNTPPMRLNDESPVMSALRVRFLFKHTFKCLFNMRAQFQYMSLIRYGSMMHRKFNHLKSSFKAVKQDTSRLEEDLRSVELERESLKDRVEKSKLFEQQYQHYMKREPEIRRYLEQYAMLAKY